MEHGSNYHTRVLFFNFQKLEMIRLIFNLNAGDILWWVITLWTSMQLTVIMTNLEHIVIGEEWYQEKDLISYNLYRTALLCPYGGPYHYPSYWRVLEFRPWNPAKPKAWYRLFIFQRWIWSDDVWWENWAILCYKCDISEISYQQIL